MLLWFNKYYLKHTQILKYPYFVGKQVPLVIGIKLLLHEQ